MSIRTTNNTHQYQHTLKNLVYLNNTLQFYFNTGNYIEH